MKIQAFLLCQKHFFWKHNCFGTRDFVSLQVSMSSLVRGIVSHQGEFWEKVFQMCECYVNVPICMWEKGRLIKCSFGIRKTPNQLLWAFWVGSEPSLWTEAAWHKWLKSRVRIVGKVKVGWSFRLHIHLRGKKVLPWEQTPRPLVWCLGFWGLRKQKSPCVFIKLSIIKC